MAERSSSWRQISRSRTSVGPGSGQPSALACRPALGLALGCAHVGNLPPGEALTTRERRDAIRRAGVWSPTNVAGVSFKAGPEAEGAFAPNAWVSCEYEVKKSSGHSPRFNSETSPGAAVVRLHDQSHLEAFFSCQATSTALVPCRRAIASEMRSIRLPCGTSTQ